MLHTAYLLQYSLNLQDLTGNTTVPDCAQWTHASHQYLGAEVFMSAPNKAILEIAQIPFREGLRVVLLLEYLNVVLLISICCQYRRVTRKPIRILSDFSLLASCAQKAKQLCVRMAIGLPIVRRELMDLRSL